MKERRKVSKELAQRLAQRMGCQYMEASAESGKGVNEVIITLVRMLRDPDGYGKQVQEGNGKEIRVKKRRGGCVVM